MPIAASHDPRLMYSSSSLGCTSKYLSNTASSLNPRTFFATYVMCHTKLFIGCTHCTTLAFPNSFQVSSTSAQSAASANHPHTRASQVRHAIAFSADLRSVSTKSAVIFTNDISGFALLELTDDRVYELLTSARVRLTSRHLCMCTHPVGVHRCLLRANLPRGRTVAHKVL